MKFLFTTNPLLGHFLPMVPLIRAAQAAGHQVRVATGADLAPEVHRHGFPIWAVGPKMSQAWAELAASADPAQDEAEQKRHAATVLFARPAVARARQLVPMAASWRPDVVVHELYELAGWEAAAASRRDGCRARVRHPSARDARVRPGGRIGGRRGARHAEPGVRYLRRALPRPLPALAATAGANQFSERTRHPTRGRGELPG